MEGSYQPFINDFRLLAVAILALYIAITAIQMFTGRAEKPKELAWTALAAIIISLVVFNYGLYKELIIDTITDQTLRLMGFFLGRNSGGNDPKSFFEIMDINFSSIFNMLNLKSAQTGWTTDWKINLLVVLLTMTYSTLYIIFAVTIIISFFSLYIFFIIGGIPLFFAIMPQTRFVFWAWLRAVATYALVCVFASIVMGVTLSFVVDVAYNLKHINFEEVGVFNEVTGNAFFVAFLAIFFLLKCAEFAAALTGGQAGGAGGILSAGIAGGALLSAGLLNNSLTRKAGSYTRDKAIAGASRAYSALKNRFGGSGNGKIQE